MVHVTHITLHSLDHSFLTEEREEMASHFVHPLYQELVRKLLHRPALEQKWQHFLLI